LRAVGGCVTVARLAVRGWAVAQCQVYFQDAALTVEFRWFWNRAADSRTAASFELC
jgi:hypothetical protein